MEKTLTENDIKLAMKNMENNNDDLDISIDNIENFFNNTINKYFKDEGYVFFQKEKDVLDHFFYNGIF